MHEEGGVTFPFTAGSAPVITSEYGWREHPTLGGTRFHAGIDIDVPEGSDDNVRTIAGGRVLAAGALDPEGYGISVVIRTPDGFIEQFSHLEFLGVAEGDVIQPGTSVGKMGSTGRSTAPHVDFVVYGPQTTDDQWMRGDYENLTVNPLDYMTMTHTLQMTPRGVGAASLPTAPLGIDSPEHAELVESFVRDFGRYRNGEVITGQFAEPASRAINNATPYRQGLASAYRSDYIAPGNVQVHNHPENNYGYRELAEDRGYRIKLHQVASRLNIPAVWLADVINYETGHMPHDPRVVNPIGCVGLIQFCPGGGLSDIAEEMGVSDSIARERLKMMTRVTQLEYVYNFIARYSNNGADLNTVEDLYAVVNGGPGLLYSSRERRRQIGDHFVLGGVQGGGYFLDHVAKLGGVAGRRYMTDEYRLRGGTGNVHEQFSPGCPECDRQMRNLGAVLPHFPP